ncbi:MAG: leucyl aminopeptidase family protein [Immundisolibacterales bacterium]|nr:leucyl aminopeptidase family protein [Immundisolibacterales bacterium]
MNTHVIGGAPEPGDVPVDLVDEKGLDRWLETQPESTRRWVRAAGFEARPHTRCLVPDARHELASVLVGVGDRADPWCCADLPGALPARRYRIRTELASEESERIAIGWGLGAYRFDRYRSGTDRRERATLHAGERIAHRAGRQIEAICLVRDLVNTPADDLLPSRLHDAARDLAGAFGAKISAIVGDDLVANGYPAIHAVGRASADPPRLVDLRWGDADAPRVTLAGKGVCFDSGGLDLKSARGIRLMKKDMGGAAHVLGLARLVMDSGLPVRLRVLVPAVENAVSANAYRPGDVLATRAGLTVEVDNTDAEGRIVLCDALTEAAREEPDVLVDFATLTGAARVALGPDLPALFSNDDDLARGLAHHADDVRDPLWRLPLHAPYAELLDSRIADISNSASSPHAGAITAALFLDRFVPDGVPWAHFDLMAWNQRSRPGRPAGGEAMALRATWAWMEKRYGH